MMITRQRDTAKEGTKFGLGLEVLRLQSILILNETPGPTKLPKDLSFELLLPYVIDP